MNLENVNVCFLVDKSGSMTPFEQSNYNGLYNFIGILRNSKIKISYFKYQSEKTIPCVVFGNISEVFPPKIDNFYEVPNMCTKINEHICESINILFDYYKKLSTLNQIPELTVFVIISDGQQDVGNPLIQASECLTRFSQTYNSIVLYFGLEEENNIHAINDFGAILSCYTWKHTTDVCYRILGHCINSYLPISLERFLKELESGFSDCNNNYANVNGYNPQDFVLSSTQKDDNE